MRLPDTTRPLRVPANLWCRVVVMGADHSTLSRLQLGGPGPPDIGAVDEVARLALQAGRLGGRIILSEVTPALRELLELAGLRVEMERETERGEQARRLEGIQEELHPGDRPV
jgi:hypothetical protein